MPLLKITARDDRPGLHAAPGDLSQALGNALAEDPGPVTIMIHGYKYQPGHPRHCPQDTLLSPGLRERRGKRQSWPRHLGFRGQKGEGIGLGFGWAARGSIRGAYARAAEAGAALGRLMDTVARADPERPIRLIAHSLGARVALSGISCCRHARARSLVLLAAAEFASAARAALSQPAAEGCRVLNVTSRENDLFDFLFEQLVPSGTDADWVLGQARGGLPMVSLQLDDPASLAALRRLGYPIAASERRICHWSPYLRPGVFPLYRAVLDGNLPLATLRAALPAEHAPRWARLWPAKARLTWTRAATTQSAG